MLNIDTIPEFPPREIRFRSSATLVSSVRELIRRRELIRVLATRDFIARYKQTILGVGWSVIQPLATVLALTLFLKRIVNPQTHGAPYIVWSFVGLIPWTFFSGAMSAGVTSLLSNQPLLNKVRCPREAFPFAALALTGVDTLISVGTLAIMFIATGTVPSATSYWIPVVLLIQLLAAAGGAVLSSIVVVYLRDLRNILPLVLQLGLFVTPVAFGLNQVSQKYRLLYCFVNPVAPVIDTYRRILLYNQQPHWAFLGAGAISGSALLLVSMEVFRDLSLVLPTSSKGTIEVSRVWKRFHADRTRPSVRDQLERLTRSKTEAGAGRWTWVLRDVDFSVGPGEAVGIVGSNGAGKSTLLKVLTGVMFPYAGRVDITGRIGALIEIRGGMHPELTGRENAYIYGTLLGLTRAEVRERFDEIVEFADLSSAIDRQLKYYSSGMQMRLGFAVAAFLRPDVLLVDEVLAVGDAWFQQRCLSRMREVLQEGTTLVFVSHDLASMEATCSRALWLDKGALRADGASREVLSDYRRAIEDYATKHLSVDGEVRCTSISVDRPDGGIPSSFLSLEVDLTLAISRSTRGRIHIGISEGSATPTVLVSTSMVFDSGYLRLRCTIDSLPLPRGRYSLWLYAESHDGLDLMPWHPATSFEIAGPDLDPAPRAVVRLAPVHVSSNWNRMDVDLSPQMPTPASVLSLSPPPLTPAATSPAITSAASTSAAPASIETVSSPSPRPGPRHRLKPQPRR